MKGAFLDWDSLGGQLDTANVTALPIDWDFHAQLDEPRLMSLLPQYDILVTNKVILDPARLAMADRLKLICVAATGTNNVDLQAAAERQIPVCNVTGYATDSVVQHVFMLIFNLLREFPAYVHDVHAQKWQTSPYFCLLDHSIRSVRDLCLGIIGYGELGQAVAATARHFGMQVRVAQSFMPGAKKDPQRLPLDTVLAEADILSLHCPLSKYTENLLDASAFAKMKSTALLINTARGGIVNERDLLVALEQKQIAGAALDVLAQEPPPVHHPLIDAAIPNLIITPHIAWASLSARQQLLDGVAQNVQSWLEGACRNRVTL